MSRYLLDHAERCEATTFDARLRPWWRRSATFVQMTFVFMTLVGVSVQLMAEPGTSAPTVNEGRALFMRQWREYDEQTPEGDGLGPMFNARSCVECHNQGGVGG